MKSLKKSDPTSEQGSILQALKVITEQTTLDELFSILPGCLGDLCRSATFSIALRNETDSRFSLRSLDADNSVDRGTEEAFPLNTKLLKLTISQSKFSQSIDEKYIEEMVDNHFKLTFVLHFEGFTVGYLVIDKFDAEVFTDSEKSDLAVLSITLSMVLGNFIFNNKKLSSVIKDVKKEKKQVIDSDTLYEIVEGVGAEIGNTFFRSLVEHLSSALNVRYAYIGELVNYGREVKTVAVWRSDRLIDNFSYSIDGPKGNACEDKVCYCCHSVKKLMPNAELQQLMRVESCWALPLNNSNEETIGVLVVMHDNPIEQEETIIPVMKIFAARSGPELERIRTEEALFNEKERAQVTLTSIGDGVITTDANGLVEYINPNAEKMLGWKNSDAKGKKFTKVFNIIEESTGEALKVDFESCKAGLNGSTSYNNAVLVRKNGSNVPIADTISPITNRVGDVVGMVIVFSDTSNFRNLMARVTYQASHDDLTGLNNRREMEKVLSAHIETCHSQHKKHALLYLDLDRFKIVNDSAGHVAGDELLKQVSAILLGCVRDNDTVARFGGDEFAVLLQGCPVGMAMDIAENIRKSLKDFHFFWKKKKFTIGASVGVLPVTQDSGDLTSVLNAADSACSVAKGQGRNNVYLYSNDDLELKKYKGDVQWSQRINEALEKNLFTLYSQKIMPLSGHDEEEEFCEILLRLRDGEELIAPMAFIPVAERFDLMVRVDRWVIKNVFEHISTLKSGGYKGVKHYAINLSGKSLGNKKTMEYIFKLAKELDIEPENVCFEITETAAIENLAVAKNFMEELKSAGFLFALDDFGTGLSSFSYLKNLPVDFIKIDGEFIRDIINNDIDSIMVESINNIGQAMGMRTIAEYAECEKSIEHLRKLGVDFAQGFGVAKPAPLKGSNK